MTAELEEVDERALSPQSLRDRATSWDAFFPTNMWSVSSTSTDSESTRSTDSISGYTTSTSLSGDGSMPELELVYYPLPTYHHNHTALNPIPIDVSMLHHVQHYPTTFGGLSDEDMDTLNRVIDNWLATYGVEYPVNE